MAGGLTVTIKTTEEDEKSDGATICAIVEPPWRDGTVRGGGWPSELQEQGFQNEGYISYNQFTDRFLVLCKQFHEPCEETSRRGRSLEEIKDETVHFETDVDIGNSCPADIVVSKSDGVLPYPRDGFIDPPVYVTSYNIKDNTVTVDVKNTWDGQIDTIFYSYKTDMFTQKCFKGTDVRPGQKHVEEGIEISCYVMSPQARLRICLQDTNLTTLK